MHLTFPLEGSAAAVLTGRSPSWFPTQAPRNYFWNTKQSAGKPPPGCLRAGREGGAPTAALSSLKLQEPLSQTFQFCDPLVFHTHPAARPMPSAASPEVTELSCVTRAPCPAGGDTLVPAAQ